MAGRRTIGVNPLSLPTAGASESGPNPLDVLIPRGEAVAAEPPTIVEGVPATVAGEPAESGGAPEVEHPVDGEDVRAADSTLASSSASGAEPAPASPTAMPFGQQVRGESDERSRQADGPESEATSPRGPVPGQYLVFEAGGESLAISIVHVREIVEYGLVTRVPRMPDSIRGVTNLRGSIVPIVDLAVRFGLPPQPRNPHTCVVVVEACLGGQPSVVGIVADTVSTVRELTHDEVSKTPALGSKVIVDAFAGLGRAGDRLFPLLDTARVFSSLDLGPKGACR